MNNDKPNTLSGWSKEVFKLHYQQSQHYRNFSSDLNKKLNYTATDAVQMSTVTFTRYIEIIPLSSLLSCLFI
jgi:hypothetical protein